MAAKLLSLPEDQFKIQFHQILQTRPIIHCKDYVGPTVAPRTEDTLRKRTKTRIKEQKDKQKELKLSQQRTKQKQSQRKNNATSTAAAVSTRKEPRITSGQFWIKLTESLARGSVNQAQASKVVQQFMQLNSKYVSSLSLEDIEDMSTRM